MNKQFYISVDEEKQETIEEINNLDTESGYFYRVTVERVRETRTNQQNRAMHKYFELLAEELNNAGLDMRRLLKREIDIPWSAFTVKEHLWRPIQKIAIGKDSTAQLKTDEPSIVYNILSKHLSETRGIYIPWPSYR